MEKVTTVGVDLSKNVFHLVGMNRAGRVVWRRKAMRVKFLDVLEQYAPEGCSVFTEATSGAHYWAREIAKRNRSARQIPAQFVRPFVKSEKNDFNDAEAACEAGNRPQMRFVPTKSVEQQELEALHRVRQRRMEERTRLSNQLRGMLTEHGVVFPQGVAKLREFCRALQADEQSLPALLRELVLDGFEELKELERRLKEFDRKLLARVRSSELLKRLASIPGIGPLTATALIAAHGDPRAFKNGRQFAAWLGLVPRQWTTGGKPKLLGITKRGDRYLRSLLIHGARAVIRVAANKDDAHSLWIQKLQAQKGMNVTAVALANKNARIAWKLLTSGEDFDPARTHMM